MLLFSLLLLMAQADIAGATQGVTDEAPAKAQPSALPKPVIPNPDVQLVLMPGTEAETELPDWAPALLDPAARPAGFSMPPSFQLCYDHYAAHFPGTSNDSLELITTWRGKDLAKRNCALAAMTRAMLSIQADEAAGRASLFSSFAKLRANGWARADQKLRCDGDALVRTALPIAMAMGLSGDNAGFIETIVLARSCPE